MFYCADAASHLLPKEFPISRNDNAIFRSYAGFNSGIDPDPLLVTAPRLLKTAERGYQSDWTKTISLYRNFIVKTEDRTNVKVLNIRLK